MDIVSSNTSPRMHLDPLCHLGFLPVADRDMPVWRNATTSNVMRGLFWVNQILAPASAPAQRESVSAHAEGDVSLNIHRCQRYWQHSLVSHSPVLLTPEQSGIPLYFSLVVLDPVSHWNLISCEERQTEHREGCEGRTVQSCCVHSMAAAVPHCRAQWGTHSTQGFSGTTGWDCTVIRARQLFVTSPLQVLPCNNNSFTEPRLCEHQHIIPVFIPCPPRACQGAQCPFSTDEPLLTVNFTPCEALLTQYTQLPCFLPKEWDVL